MCTQAITVDRNTVMGTPLTLEFEKVFLRPPTPPESDIIFTAHDLMALGNGFWAAFK
jgi:hypothetical protein